MEEIRPKKDLLSTLRGGLFIANLNDVCDHYEIKSPIYKNFIKKRKCIHTNGMPENGLIYVCEVFQFNAINASTTHTQNVNHETSMPILHIKSTFTFQ